MSFSPCWQTRCFQLDVDLAEHDGEQQKRNQIWKEFLKEREEVTDKESCSPLVSFDPSWSWFNGTVTSSHLSGRLVLLDFFTYCCLNCLHILPTLRDIEEEFKSEDHKLLVLGVHSAKFEHERGDENVRSAVERSDIGHPVVNDRECKLWKGLEVQCWPTVVVLHPKDGREVKRFVGEAQVKNLKEFVKVAMKFYAEKGMIKPEETVTIVPNNIKMAEKKLNYPGKITVGKDNIYLTDTGNHRVLEVHSGTGNVSRVFGNGQRGFVNGSQAQFNDPQGTCFVPPNMLIVADTANHAVRTINLDSGAVDTLVGDGTHGTDLEGGKARKEQPIASPWDVCLGKSPKATELDTVFIAMAGLHQIWAYCLKDSEWYKGQMRKEGECFAVAGNGKEENRNNSYPLKSAFAQPSGVSFSDKLHSVFIADSESSSIRQVKIGEGGIVKNVVGGARDPSDLFAFGDQDGKSVDAKLQHPMDVQVGTEDAEGNPTLLIADTYNNKIKLVSGVATKNSAVCATLALEGVDMKEPGGMALDTARENLYVADTNNSSVRVLNLNSFAITDFPVSFSNSGTDEMDSSVRLSNIALKESEYDQVETVTVFGNSVTNGVELSLQFIAGSQKELNQTAPNKLSILDNEVKMNHGGQWNEVELKLPNAEKQSVILVAKVYVCDNAMGTCVAKMIKIELNVEFNAEKGNKSVANIKLT